MLKYLSLCLAMLLTACLEPYPIEVQREESAKLGIVTDNRFEVKRIAIIADELAYRGERGVYLITDSKTGKEYVGLSGIGISEIGSHSSGKTRREDER
ncbi:hypothetical protein LVJ85_02240 [Neisseria sp. Dent CA1/247]|uniref:hypothetical protein n=1 Tax=Neisseria sp. Dent CA1/247 TaxID=2912675 RepID=UPI001FD00AED|nr:hypothetical protein [Neisseria sp. Dent CA1/247]UOO77341.1 hypothetical protein LVJ85_02240 [Neisseria sp. Dent CA1/247]